MLEKKVTFFALFAPALFTFLKSSTAHAILLFLAAFFMSRKSNNQPAFFSSSFTFFTFFSNQRFPAIS
jgi:hypothetical protein